MYRRNRRQEEDWQLPDPRRPLPGDPSALQTVEAGVGPIYHRRYWVQVADSELSPEELITAVVADIDAMAPGEMSMFEAMTSDGADPLEVGDELVVRLPGPWDGPVRVIDRTATSFRFATLDGHLEAGEIEFRSSRKEHGFVQFEIESWTRSGDRFLHLLYDRFAVAREIQLLMWSQFCRRVAKRSGGVLMTNVCVHTDRTEAERHVRTTGELSRAAQQALDELHQLPVNFDVERRAELASEEGWHLDEYCQQLPPEAPGDPVEDGSWETARRLLERYEFADPDIVRAVYYPDVPLEERDMLLEGRFWGLRFLLGLRIGGVIDQRIDEDGRPVRLWGWNYRTLQGHLEMGQMDYEVRKWLDTGEVEFRICAISSAAAISNPVIRFGFRVFGRRMQVQFARRALQRMSDLVEAELLARTTGVEGPTDRPPVADIDVRPANERPDVSRRLDEQRRS